MSGQTDFQDDLEKTVKDAGGLHTIVRSNYGRNIWRVMKELHVLPTDPSFQNLSSEQLDFIVASIDQDNKELKRAQEGREEDSFVYDDEFEWEEEMDYGGKRDDSEDIQKFLEAAKKKDEDYERLIEDRESLKDKKYSQIQEDDDDEYHTL